MKRMLINATQEEELRMAMVDGQRLYDLNIELPSGERKKANIYKGKITRVEPSLEAAFVNYGADRHGFLPLKEISSEYFVNEVASGNKPNIREILKEGQDIVVQIDKEERGNKGAALTTFVSLAGRFVVLKPNKPKSGGVSRRIVGEERDIARESLGDVNIPDGMSVILRTAGIDRDTEELEWDVNNLLAIWEAIKSVVVARPSPFLIYRESNAVVRALRDYLTNEIGEILIDDQATYKEAQEFIEQVMPHNQRKLKHYTDPVPLFTRYQIESQIESAFAHNVDLPSGGSIVIDHTEALVAIDINSARATKGSDIEETAVQTNLEAAEEVGRQLRLRDLGGLIVIDFIDMGPQKNQRAVETRLREAVRQDRARVQFGKISRFGLLEMSRQRLRPSLGESSYLVCPRCTGIGNIRSVESLALAILRLIGEEARKERTAKVIAQLPVEVATYLLNEKREWVQSLESRHEMQVILVANPLLETPHYQVRRVRDDQLDLPENVGTSFALVEMEEEQVIPQAIQGRPPLEMAAVATSASTSPPPKHKTAAPPSVGFWAWLTGLFTSAEPEAPKKRAAGRRPQKKRDGRSSGAQRDSRRRNEPQKSGQARKAPRKKPAAKKTAKKTTKKTDAAGSKRKARSNATDSSVSESKVDESAAPLVATASGDEASNEPRKTSSRRRSRGGRRRRRNPETAETATKATDEQQNNTATESSAKGRTDSAANKPERDEVKTSSVAAVPAAMTEQPVEEKKQDNRNETVNELNKHEPDDRAEAMTDRQVSARKPKQDDRKKADDIASDRLAPVAMESQHEVPAVHTADKPQVPDASYKDRQPELPGLREPMEEKKVAAEKIVSNEFHATAAEVSAGDIPKPRSPRQAASASASADKSDQPSSENSAAPMVDSSNTPTPGNDSDAAMPGGERKATPAPAEKKPAGRLLPWAVDPAPVQKEQATDSEPGESKI